MDLRIWFDQVQIYDTLGKELSLEEFYQGANKWWTQMHKDGGHTSFPPTDLELEPLKLPPR